MQENKGMVMVSWITNISEQTKKKNRESNSYLKLVNYVGHLIQKHFNIFDLAKEKNSPLVRKY